MKRVALYLLAFIALASIAFAAPTISITVGTGFDRTLEVSWNVTSDVNLTSLKLVRENDNKTIVYLPLTGNHVNDFARDYDVDVVSTYTYTLMIWDETSAITTASASAKLDIDPPKISSPLTITSATKQLTITLDEPGKCIAGLDNNSMVVMNDSGNNTYVATIPQLKEGQNIVYVICTDPYNNEFQKPVAISFTLQTADTTKPSKPSISITNENGSAKFSWAASTDSSGIKEYRIYKSTDKDTVFSSTPQATTGLFFTDNPTQTTYYAVGAVDNAGNEERSEIVQLIVQGQPTQTPAPTTQTKTAAPAKAGGFRAAYIAWIVFAVIIIILMLQYRRKKSDKFGLDSYLAHRRKHFG